jgi:hypothetical protein
MFQAPSITKTLAILAPLSMVFSPVSATADDAVTWSTTPYSETLEPAMDELRITNGIPQNREETIAKLGAAWTASSIFADNVHVVLQRRGENTSALRVDNSCVQPFRETPSGRVENEISRLNRIIQRCFDTIHRIIYTHPITQREVPLPSYINLRRYPPQSLEIRAMIEIRGAMRELRSLRRGSPAFMEAPAEQQLKL